MKHTNAQPTSIHPLAIGTWVRSAKTGAVGQVVGIHIRSGCSEEPAAVSWPHCEHPFFMYDLQIGDGTHFYGPDTLELTEAPTMTQDTPNETAPAPTPDPWDIATPATVEEVKAEVAATEEEASEQVKAAFDEAAQARAQLAGAVAVINADTDALAVLRSKRARALKLARLYYRRWQTGIASTQKARHKLKTALTITEFQKRELQATKDDLVNLRRDMEAARLAGQWDGFAAELNYSAYKTAQATATELARANEDANLQHAYALTEDGEAAQLADKLAEAREQITRLAREVNTLRAASKRNERRLDSTPQPSGAVDTGAQSDAVALRDQMTELLAVMRQFGYVAYENEARVKPEDWLKLRLANIGEPVQGSVKRAG